MRRSFVRSPAEFRSRRADHGAGELPGGVQAVVVIGYGLSLFVALAFLGVGAAAAFAPKTLAKNYGIPTVDEAAFAYIRAVGARDAVLGLIVFALAATRDFDALALALALCALAGAADFSIVLGARGLAARTSLTIHGAGTIGLVVAALLVRAGR